MESLVMNNTLECWSTKYTEYGAKLSFPSDSHECSGLHYQCNSGSLKQHTLQTKTLSQKISEAQCLQCPEYSGGQWAELLSRVTASIDTDLWSNYVGAYRTQICLLLITFPAEPQLNKGSLGNQSIFRLAAWKMSKLVISKMIISNSIYKSPKQPWLCIVRRVIIPIPRFPNTVDHG